MEDLRMTEAIPYLPSTRWVTRQKGHILPTVKLKQVYENVSEAPQASYELSPRDYTRTLIESNTPEGLTLTVPIRGGASMVKQGKIRLFRISEHGRWRHVHLGALRAAYEREPFFQHLFPDLEEEYDDEYGESSDFLLMFNLQLWLRMKEFLRLDEVLPQLESVSDREKARFASLRDSMLSRIDPSHTFLEPLFRFGPDAIFLLS